MRFLETNNIITVPNYKKSFIYFLLKNNEVAYVGQTKNGLIRPLSHTDKEYDTIKILYCDVQDLDVLEDKFIKKYKPYYNKSINYMVNCSLASVNKRIKRIVNDKTYNLRKLKKIINELNIKIYYIEKKPFIYIDDYFKISDYIKRQSIKNEQQ